MSEGTIMETYERDGWTISVEFVPDYDYQPGRDDDIYPRFEEVRYDDDERDYDGQFVRQPIIVDSRQGPVKVTPEEIDRLTDIGWGEDATPSQRRRARAWIKHAAEGIAHEDLTWVGVVVRASNGTVSGTASLWGIDYDTRDKNPDAYPLSVAHDELTDEAIEEAAKRAVGNLATLALSY